MEASLQVPTATSVRGVPAKLLEVNRRVINGYLGRTKGGKVSFTHIIGYAIVKAISESVPVMAHRLDHPRRPGRDVDVVAELAPEVVGQDVRVDPALLAFPLRGRRS